MVVTFDKISDESRIWIFQSNRLIPDLDIESLKKEIDIFCLLGLRMEISLWLPQKLSIIYL